MEQDRRRRPSARQKPNAAEAKAKGYEGEMCGESALFAGAERDLHEVRYVWVNDGVFVIKQICGAITQASTEGKARVIDVTCRVTPRSRMAEQRFRISNLSQIILYKIT